MKTLIMIVSLMFCAGVLRAQTPIQANDYKLDLSEGPVRGSVREVAMGGAFVSIAEGAEGLRNNPAAAANRGREYEKNFLWDFEFGSETVNGDDPDNSGSRAVNFNDERRFTVGLLGIYKKWGAGFLANTGQVDLQGPARDAEFNPSAGIIAVGRTFLDHRVVMGVGLRANQTTIEGPSGELTDETGLGFSVGFLFRPARGPLQIGVAYHSEVISDNDAANSSTGPATVNGVIVPGKIAFPTEVVVGGSVEFDNGDYLSKRPVLMSLDFRYKERLADVAGLEGALTQSVQPIGRNPKLSVHLGAEHQTFPDRLRLRAGAYTEPAPFGGATPRTHGTAGFEARLFKLPYWDSKSLSFSMAFDFAEDYQFYGASVGLW